MISMSVIAQEEHQYLLNGTSAFIDKDKRTVRIVNPTMYASILLQYNSGSQRVSSHIAYGSPTTEFAKKFYDITEWGNTLMNFIDQTKALAQGDWDNLHALQYKNTNIKLSDTTQTGLYCMGGLFSLTADLTRLLLTAIEHHSDSLKSTIAINSFMTLYQTKPHISDVMTFDTFKTVFRIVYEEAKNEFIKVKLQKSLTKLSKKYTQLSNIIGSPLETIKLSSIAVELGAYYIAHTQNLGLEYDCQQIDLKSTENNSSFSQKITKLKNMGYISLNTKHEWGNGVIQDFKHHQHGQAAIMQQNNSNNAYIVLGDIWRKYTGTDGMNYGLDGANGALGYPISSEYKYTLWNTYTTQRQDFERGYIVWIREGQFFGYTQGFDYNNQSISQWSKR